MCGSYVCVRQFSRQQLYCRCFVVVVVVTTVGKLWLSEFIFRLISQYPALPSYNYAFLYSTFVHTHTYTYKFTSTLRNIDFYGELIHMRLHVCTCLGPVTSKCGMISRFVALAVHTHTYWKHTHMCTYIFMRVLWRCALKFQENLFMK